MVASVGIQQKAGSSSNFSNGGDGRAYDRVKHFGEAKELSFYDKNEERLSFTKTMDPAEVAFKHLDNMPVKKLASMYFKENVRNPMKNLFSKLG